MDAFLHLAPSVGFLIGFAVIVMRIFTGRLKMINLKLTVGWTGFWLIILMSFSIYTYFTTTNPITWSDVGPYAVFLAIVLFLLWLDQKVFHKHEGSDTVRKAALWSVFWIALSCVFGVYVIIDRGQDAGVTFFTGYLIEKSLSVDNLFVFLAIFSYFNVPAAYQHRVLFWGILGALVFRGILIAVGTGFVTNFHFLLYIFGAFLLVTGIKLLKSEEEELVEVEKIKVLKYLRRYVPMTETYDGTKFFTRDNLGGLIATPLLAVVIVIETTDIMFAVDSIPAIFGITQDPYIIFTSNVCAILGLRALYFVLESIIDKFFYLRHGISVVLAFVGVKMLLPLPHDLGLMEHELHVATWVSLVVVLGLLTLSVIASIIRSRRIDMRPGTPIEKILEEQKEPGIL